MTVTTASGAEPLNFGPLLRDSRWYNATPPVCGIDHPTR